MLPFYKWLTREIRHSPENHDVGWKIFHYYILCRQCLLLTALYNKLVKYCANTHLDSFKIVITFKKLLRWGLSVYKVVVLHSVLNLLIIFLAGVGKSSLVHLLCHNQMLGNPSWTVGCSVDVRVGKILNQQHLV